MIDEIDRGIIRIIACTLGLFVLLTISYTVHLFNERMGEIIMMYSLLLWMGAICVVVIYSLIND